MKTTAMLIKRSEKRKVDDTLGKQSKETNVPAKNIKITTLIRRIEWTELVVPKD